MNATGLHWAGIPLRAVLFDLDGTLIDTLADIALALNRTLGECGIEPIEIAAVRPLVGRGAAQLITRALEVRGQAVGEPRVAALFERFMHHYAELLERGDSSAVAYPGALEALRDLCEAGAELAVVTNKARRLAQATLQSTGLRSQLRVVVGGDSCERRKPHPDPLLHACRQLGVESTAALMVGDSVNDVLAARAAGIPVLCVPYGYNEGVDSRTLRCDGFVEHLAELPRLLRR